MEKLDSVAELRADLEACSVDTSRAKGYEDMLPAHIDVGKTPHWGRGAGFNQPKFGPVWATVQFGDENIARIATGPARKKYRRYACRSAAMLKGDTPLTGDLYFGLL